MSTMTASPLEELRFSACCWLSQSQRLLACGPWTVGAPSYRSPAFAHGPSGMSLLEANSGARSRALGCASTAAHVAWPRRVGPATAAAIMSPLVAPVATCRGGRRCLSESRGQVANFRVFRSRSNRCVFNCKCRDFVPIHICHLSQHTLSTRYCHFASSWNCPATRPPRLQIT